MSEVYCIKDFVEDGYVYWSEGNYYNIVGTDGENTMILTNFNSVGCVYPEDFDDHFLYEND